MNIKRIVVGELMTNCYLVYNNKEMIVVDPGDDADIIIKKIQQIGITPKLIINTHSHFDHILANKDVQRFTGAEIAKNLQEGDDIFIGDEKLKVLYTPGHTNDSICLLGNKFIISGDVLFFGGYGRTDLPEGSDDKMKKTLHRLQNELDKETIIYPGHGKPFKMKEW